MIQNVSDLPTIFFEKTRQNYAVQSNIFFVDAAREAWIKAVIFCPWGVFVIGADQVIFESAHDHASDESSESPLQKVAFLSKLIMIDKNLS